MTIKEFHRKNETIKLIRDGILIDMFLVMSLASSNTMYINWLSTFPLGIHLRSRNTAIIKKHIWSLLGCLDVL